MATNRPLRVTRPATIAFSPNIVRPWLAGRFRTASVDPRPPGEKMLTAQAPVGHARYPAPGAGSGKSGAVTSRALYVSPDPAPSPPPQIWHASHPLSPLLKRRHVSPQVGALALVVWYLMQPPLPDLNTHAVHKTAPQLSGMEEG